MYKAPSLDSRHEILIPEVPKLGMESALKAIKEWGQAVNEKHGLGKDKLKESLGKDKLKETWNDD